MPAFADVEAQIKSSARDLGAQLTVAGESDGYPLYVMRFGCGEPIWLSAGIHGEEPGSVAGMLRFLECSAHRWMETFAMTVMPCLNPWGYERGIRGDEAQRDLNRQFRNDAVPLVKIVNDVLQKPKLALDLHEDCDFFGFYLYEISERDRFGPKIVEAVRAVGPISDGTDWPEPDIEDGIAMPRRHRDENFRQAMLEWEQWPIAWPLFLAAGHVMTIETPGRQPLDLRAAMHERAVNTALTLQVGEAVN